MRGKLMFVAGLGVGYILGARAGREKFDELVARARKMWESPTVQEAAGVVQSKAVKIYDNGRHVVTEQLHKIGQKGKKGAPEKEWAMTGPSEQAGETMSSAQPDSF